MKERPILFSDPMIRALLAGQKTMTRRVVNPYGLKLFHAAIGAGEVNDFLASGVVDDMPYVAGFCPYGRLGDRLWVREAWTIMSVSSRTAAVAYRERLKPGQTLADTDGGLDLIGLDGEQAFWAAAHVDGERWKPSIHMPRWASRLTLEIVDVRVERIQDISEADAQAEGVSWGRCMKCQGEHVSHFVCQFRELWDSINEKRGFGWNVNPWCWCITFKLLV